jgi:translation elongation factor EF-G
MAIEPKTQADRDKLHASLQALADEDPTFMSSRTPTPGRP